MRSFRLVSLLALLLAATSFAASAAPALPAIPVPAAPDLAVKSYVLQDFYSGRVIASSSADKRIAPASLTKLMTLYVAFSSLAQERIHLDDKVHIGKQAWSTGGSRMFLPLNAEVTVKTLIRGIIVDSGNDAAVALANYIGGSTETFATAMNEYAHRLGMDGTHFVNATGLPDPDHYTTAADLARLSRALIRDFPSYYRFFSERTLTFNKISQRNRNGLLWSDKSVDGLKTGHTEEAGYNLIVSAKRDGDRMIAVVIGADSSHAREAHCEALLNYGFRFYTTRRLYAANDPVTRIRVWEGGQDAVELGLSAPLYVTVPQGHEKELQARDRLQAQVVAPVTKGQTLGTLEVSLGDQLLAQVPLHALDAVPEGGWWSRMTDGATLFFSQYFPSLAAN